MCVLRAHVNCLNCVPNFSEFILFKNLSIPWSTVLPGELTGTQLVKDFSKFIEPESSLPYSQERTIHPYPQLGHSSPCLSIPFLKNHFNVDKKNQLDVTFCILNFSSNSCSKGFGQPCAHHQELTTAWCYSLVLVCAVAATRCHFLYSLFLF